VKKYPDISRLLRQKGEHRRALAALPFEKKIEMVFRLSERRASIRRAVARAGSKKPSRS
jgi:hypothetical protein